MDDPGAEGRKRGERTGPRRTETGAGRLWGPEVRSTVRSESRTSLQGGSSSRKIDGNRYPRQEAQSVKRRNLTLKSCMDQGYAKHEGRLSRRWDRTNGDVGIVDRQRKDHCRRHRHRLRRLTSLHFPVLLNRHLQFPSPDPVSLCGLPVFTL